MFDALKKFLKDIFSENDGEAGDMIMVAAFAGFATFLGLEIHSVVFKGAAFDMIQYGTAYGVMLAGLGVAFKMKLDAQTKAETAPKKAEEGQ